MRYLDLAIIVAYLAGITLFGAHFRRGQKNLRDYFLGGRTAPWWAISLSIVSAETSTLTIVGTPALAFAGNMAFLQLVFGYLLARIVISLVFLPQYFRGEMYTAYELMRRRFGERIRRLTASIFLVTRALAEGVRVFAISLVISIVLGTGEIASIVLIVLLTLFYTFEGGMTAVIWTDVVQMGLYVAGALVSFFVILGKIPGGWEHVSAVAGAAHKFDVFDFRFAFNMEFFSRTYSFWAGIAGGCFLTTASHGTDQLMVQRLLSARNQAQSRAALLASWAGDLRTIHPVPADRHPALRLLRRPAPRGTAAEGPHLSRVRVAQPAAGRCRHDYRRDSGGRHGEPERRAEFAGFHHGSGLLPRAGKGIDDRKSILLARFATVAWGGVLLLIAIGAAQVSKSVLDTGLKIASIPFGALLGVFLLGVLTKKPGQSAAIAGTIAGLGTVLYLNFYTPVAWSWYVLIGTCVTFGVGMLASLFEHAGNESDHGINRQWWN